MVTGTELFDMFSIHGTRLPPLMAGEADLSGQSNLFYLAGSRPFDLRSNSICLRKLRQCFLNRLETLLQGPIGEARFFRSSLALTHHGLRLPNEMEEFSLPRSRALTSSINRHGNGAGKWSDLENKELRYIKDHVRQLRYSPDGKLLLSVGDDGRWGCQPCSFRRQTRGGK